MGLPRWQQMVMQTGKWYVWYVPGMDVVMFKQVPLQDWRTYASNCPDCYSSPLSPTNFFGNRLSWGNSCLAHGTVTSTHPWSALQGCPSLHIQTSCHQGPAHVPFSSRGLSRFPSKCSFLLWMVCSLPCSITRWDRGHPVKFESPIHNR